MAKPSVVFGGKTTGVAFRAAYAHHEDKIPRRSTNLSPWPYSPAFPCLPIKDKRKKKRKEEWKREGSTAHWGFVTEQRR
jgi:hypothetical protein